MTITIRLKTDNAAFEDDKKTEVFRILSEWIENGKRGILASKLRDYNGNTVGTVTMTGQ